MSNLTLKEFNLRFLTGLTGIIRTVRYPLLKAAGDDIKSDGLFYTAMHWQHFIGIKISRPEKTHIDYLAGLPAKGTVIKMEGFDYDNK